MTPLVPKEHRPLWIVVLAFAVCGTALFLALRAGFDDRYLEALGFLALAVLGALLPRIFNLVLSYSAKDQRATAAVNAAPVVEAESGALTDPNAMVDAATAIADAANQSNDANVSQALAQRGDDPRPNGDPR